MKDKAFLEELIKRRNKAQFEDEYEAYSVLMNILIHRLK